MDSNFEGLTPVVPSPSPISPRKIGLIILVTLVFGGLAGFGLSRSSSPNQIAGISATPQVINTDSEKGVTDTQTFGDVANGKLETGGLNGEGTHKLIRDGGPSQTVYLISSIVDLEAFVGKQVEVSGQTIKAQKAPWLMDVGRIKLIQ